MDRPTRRHLIAGISALPLAGLAAAVPAATLAATHPDAELVAIGHETAALIEQRRPLEVQWWTLPPEPGDQTAAEKAELQAVADALEPIDGRLDHLLDRALELPATTREGIATKARLIRHELRLCHSSDGVMEFASMDPGERLAWSLSEDLLGAGVA